jgi:hypothetical protein
MKSRDAVDQSTRSKISDPYPIGAIGDRHLGVPVAKVAVEHPSFVAPTDTIPSMPLRRYADGRCLRASDMALTGLAGFAGW